MLELDEFLLVRGVARSGHVGGVDEAVGHLGLAFGGDAHGGDDAEGLHAGLGGLDEEIAHAGDALEGADAGSAELVHLVAGSALDAAHAAGRGGGLGDGGSRGRGAEARGLDNLRDPGGIAAREVGSALGDDRPKLSDGGGHGSGDRRIGRRVVCGGRSLFTRRDSAEFGRAAGRRRDDAGGLCDVHEPNYARGRDRRSLALPPGEGAGVVGVPLTRRARRLMRLPLAPGLFVIERPIRERSLFRRVTF